MINKAAKLINGGNLNEALQVYEQAIANKPDSPTLRLRRADLLRKMGRPNMAKHEYRKVAEEYERKGIFAKASAVFKLITSFVILVAISMATVACGDIDCTGLEMVNGRYRVGISKQAYNPFGLRGIDLYIHSPEGLFSAYIEAAMTDGHCWMTTLDEYPDACVADSIETCTYIDSDGYEVTLEAMCSYEYWPVGNGQLIPSAAECRVSSSCSATYNLAFTKLGATLPRFIED
jgi:hypothetical protein